MVKIHSVSLLYLNDTLFSHRRALKEKEKQQVEYVVVVPGMKCHR